MGGVAQLVEQGTFKGLLPFPSTSASVLIGPSPSYRSCPSFPVLSSGIRYFRLRLPPKLPPPNVGPRLERATSCSGGASPAEER